MIANGAQEFIGINELSFDLGFTTLPLDCQSPPQFCTSQKVFDPLSFDIPTYDLGDELCPPSLSQVDSNMSTTTSMHRTAVLGDHNISAFSATSSDLLVKEARVRLLKEELRRLEADLA